MNKATIKILEIAKAFYSRIFKKDDKSDDFYSYLEKTGEDASDIIKKILLKDEPAMICRFGTGELHCLLSYYFMQQPKSFFKKSIDYIRGDISAFWWEKDWCNSMFINTGFFPINDEMLEKFCKRMLYDIKYIDVLGVFSFNNEKFLKNELSSAVKVRFKDIEPYYHANPWTECLAGKKVLVVHPYEKSIKSQYLKRKLLFSDKRILPEFELETIKAVQSIAGNKTEFKDWFEALHFMEQKISDTDFDVAIIGCGAYGFPLAAHVKRMGKKAIHLGGPTQILFGIKGKRWENNEFISKLFNEHWVRPLSEERPENFNLVEGGCYW